MFGRRCKHELVEISWGFSIGDEGVSPTILSCKKCRRYFEMNVEGKENIIKEIKIQEEN